MKKTILALLMTALLGICTSAFAIDRNSEIAIMDFGTRPGATEAEIRILLWDRLMMLLFLRLVL